VVDVLLTWARRQDDVQQNKFIGKSCGQHAKANFDSHATVTTALHPVTWFRVVMTSEK
jgi:hypothetical protein